MTRPMLEVEGLTKHFPIRKGLLGRVGAVVQAVSDVSFSVNEGETLAIVGESGCGKSTTGRALMRLIEPDSGSVRLGGEAIEQLPDYRLRAARRQMQMVFQDPFGSLNPRMNVRETLLEPILLHDVASGARAQARVSELLKLVGLSDFHAERYPHEFSGGQRQRICIARAIASRPRLIVCDEPVSALDVSVQAQIVNLLQDLQRRFGLTYVFISHDLAVVRHIAHKVAVMYLGRIVEMAETADLFANPRHPYTRALIAAAPRPVAGAARPAAAVRGDAPSALRLPSGCAFHPRCPAATDLCRRERPALRTDGAAQIACHLRADQLPAMPALAAGPASPILERRQQVLARARMQQAATVATE